MIYKDTLLYSKNIHRALAINIIIKTVHIINRIGKYDNEIKLCKMRITYNTKIFVTHIKNPLEEVIELLLSVKCGTYIT